MRVKGLNTLVLTIIQATNAVSFMHSSLVSHYQLQYYLCVTRPFNYKALIAINAPGC